VELSITISTVEEACKRQEQFLWEFQRWQPLLQEWGNSKHHLGYNDPGAWGTEEGTRFGKDMESVVADMPSEEWVPANEWYTIATDLDAEGWHYATSFDSPFWHTPRPNNNCEFHLK
jgi:hypothetical protein